MAQDESRGGSPPESAETFFFASSAAVSSLRYVIATRAPCFAKARLIDSMLLG